MSTEGKKFVPVMITPFDAKGKIDKEALTALIEFYLSAGVKGLFANCLSSEMFSITEEESIELTAHVVKQARGRVPVVASGSFGDSMEEKAAYAKKITDTGIEAVVLITSHFADRDDRDETLLANFNKLFDLTGAILFGTYECPAPYKRILSADVLKQLVATGRLIYHKDTCLVPSAVKEKLDVLNTIHHRLEFYDAHTPNAHFSLQNGAKGMSSISGNFYPEIMVWMCNHATDPAKQKEVEWLQSELTRVDPLIHQAYPVSAKYFLQKRGLPIRTTSRTYVHELTADQEKVLDQIHHDFIGWCETLGIKQTI